jgi:phospholipase D1/2
VKKLTSIDMYDRTRVPRTPWHDIAMQVVGQPARDLTRHFVQRWNYLLRQRKPSRPTPVLLPPPDFVPSELEGLGIGGTCEVQILRSACAWSLGTPDRVEKSILNAYLKAIETSDHFVYIENQFFITSTELEGTIIENSIGDALVERIIRAWRNDEDWRAVILIPLMPGFESTVDSQDGSSVRLIMQCQYRSISRGPHSIFGKLKNAGIEPEDFIQFYSLRNWGKIGKEEGLVTEQLYIHAKVMIVDDRIAIIGSANINERSMLGSRDSEVAAFVRDTETFLSTMAGQPYRVGKFPHTLRVRLMREHLGIDVDEIMAIEQQESASHGAPDWELHVKNWQKEKDTNFTTGNLDYDSENAPSVAGASDAPSDAPSVPNIVMFSGTRIFTASITMSIGRRMRIRTTKPTSVLRRILVSPITKSVRRMWMDLVMTICIRSPR